MQKFVSKVDGSMKIRHERENLNKAAIKIESYWPVDPVSDEVEKVFHEAHKACILPVQRLFEKCC